MKSVTFQLPDNVVKVIKQMEKEHGEKNVNEMIGASILLYLKRMDNPNIFSSVSQKSEKQ